MIFNVIFKFFCYFCVLENPICLAYFHGFYQMLMVFSNVLLFFEKMYIFRSAPDTWLEMDGGRGVVGVRC